MLDLETTTAIETTATSSAADEASFNRLQNLAALAETQPNLVASRNLENLKWTFARDGTLTALENGKWWGGCSVPAKAAEELLRPLQITASVACFLAPAHPAQILFALRRLKT